MHSLQLLSSCSSCTWIYARCLLHIKVFNVSDCTTRSCMRSCESWSWSFPYSLLLQQSPAQVLHIQVLRHAPLHVQLFRRRVDHVLRRTLFTQNPRDRINCQHALNWSPHVAGLSEVGDSCWADPSEVASRCRHRWLDVFNRPFLIPKAVIWTMIFGEGGPEEPSQVIFQFQEALQPLGYRWISHLSVRDIDHLIAGHESTGRIKPSSLHKNRFVRENALDRLLHVVVDDVVVL
ncbi:uncharacterized protein SPPG_09524 [Spizellomyces punctatus DAOM BR117]|uniref:Uncharacterized protein n=1 Tax=Spizellomyces punctatus (strain DAOM BR117) TaxID=645134 RepID=A0A0L0H518_SPIPD|nr:uncharacterized protein SPPG_09524 [Spizellomyces punctatus DAOM BR117]KNC96317.1 hypothetical protein SPPG_09524 [Spizellomyces punctatus DAOM BR117]|eukprot:XP_016604357.1 hypothetical protein SPPG_09524 [Spizellomyces punctatus DAOM BR117]